MGAEEIESPYQLEGTDDDPRSGTPCRPAAQSQPTHGDARIAHKTIACSLIAGRLSFFPWQQFFCNSLKRERQRTRPQSGSVRREGVNRRSLASPLNFDIRWA
jgi:hypothetical protein